MYENIHINRFGANTLDESMLFEEPSTPDDSVMDVSSCSSGCPLTTTCDDDRTGSALPGSRIAPNDQSGTSRKHGSYVYGYDDNEELNGFGLKVSGPVGSETGLAHYYNETADSFVDFMNSSPTTRHVVKSFIQMLRTNGFQEINERKFNSTTTCPGKYYMIRNGQCLAAFVLGGSWSPERGSCFIGCHIDALCIKLNAANSFVPQTNEGYHLLGVAPYSGALTNQWLNRDFGLAGSVIVQKNGKVERILVSSGTLAVAFIPKLAEHFNVERSYSLQTEMVPIFAQSPFGSTLEATDEEKTCVLYGQHLLLLLRYVSKLSNANVSDILGLDLELVDIQPAVRGGLGHEFINSGALDDRLCSYDAMMGLLEFSSLFSDSESLKGYDGFSGVYLADNEEIGSNTRTGAGGGLLQDVMRSVVSSRFESTPERMARLFNETIIISSDVTHALNPNFKQIYLDRNFPLPNIGPSIKFDSNGHVLSDSIGEIFAKTIIETYLPDIKLQRFHIRNDSRSGSTIGPILSGKRGIPGAKMIVDIGMPILSMHSIRGMTGYKDVGMGIRFFRQVLTHWQSTPSEIFLGPE